MRIFVTGGTGVIGRRAVAVLRAAGHDIWAAARSDVAAERLRRAGAVAVPVDLFDRVAVRRAVVDAGAEAVVNLATSIPPMRRSTRRGAWELNDRLRTEVSGHLVDAAISAGSAAVIQESVAFLYGDHGDRWITEDSPLAPSWFTPAVRAAEHNTARFGGFGRAVVLRFGGFMAHDAEFTIALLRSAGRGTLLDAGPRRGYFPWVDVDDAALAVRDALTWQSGTYNVVDDSQLTRVEKSRVLATAVGRKRPLRILPPAVTYLAGGAGDAARRSMRVSNAAARAAGWSAGTVDPVTRWQRLAARVAESAAPTTTTPPTPVARP